MEVSKQTYQHGSGANPILNAGGVNQHRQQQPQGIHGNVAFAPFDFLASIETALPPFNVVLTDCESMMATLGLAFLPARRRSAWRKASSARRHAPDKRQRRNRAYTLDHWPKSLGNCRHWHPVLSTYKIALTSQRTSLTGGGPPLGPGMYGPTSSGCNIAHCPSVKSLGYTAHLP